MAFVERHKSMIQPSKIAFIGKIPRHAVDAQVSDSISTKINANIQFKPFSTYKAAYKWLGANK